MANKTYTIRTTRYRSGRQNDTTGTMAELLEHFGYVLQCGQSWQHEKGNKKINMEPKTGKALVTQLNNAARNTAANGCSDTYYGLIEC